MTNETQERNKEVVRRFNKEILEQGKFESFQQLVDKDFINRTAPPNANEAEGLWNTFSNVLRPAFPDLTVEIHDQVAEGDKVVSRKTISATHKAKIFDVLPTGQKIKIEVIDIVRVKDGKYIEHWGINTLQTVLAELRKV
ncbi:ester cyclase [Chryseolinea sp. T2]|uniref:ester cyclase n=1 Tax=Chryseolinea sp. T2 TaxID=3129255 RepID=UPI003076B612